MEQRKIQLHPSITEIKIYLCFCLQYYCMGHRKNSIDTRLNWHSKAQLALDLHKKNIYIFVSGYSITMIYLNYKNLSHWTITKRNIFLSYYSTIVVHRTTPPLKNPLGTALERHCNIICITKKDRPRGWVGGFNTKASGWDYS